MCDIIDARPILANLLKYNDKPVSIPKLKEIASELGNLDKYLYIDITDDSIQMAVELHNNMFQWTGTDDEDIARANDSDKYFNDDRIDKMFNSRITST